MQYIDRYFPKVSASFFTKFVDYKYRTEKKRLSSFCLAARHHRQNRQSRGLRQRQPPLRRRKQGQRKTRKHQTGNRRSRQRHPRNGEDQNQRGGRRDPEAGEQHHERRRRSEKPNRRQHQTQPEHSREVHSPVQPLQILRSAGHKLPPAADHRVHSPRSDMRHLWEASRGLRRRLLQQGRR